MEKNDRGIAENIKIYFLKPYFIKNIFVVFEVKKEYLSTQNRNIVLTCFILKKGASLWRVM